MCQVCLTKKVFSWQMPATMDALEDFPVDSDAYEAAKEVSLAMACCSCRFCFVEPLKLLESGHDDEYKRTQSATAAGG